MGLVMYLHGQQKDLVANVMIWYDSISGTCSCYCFDRIFSREILHIETFLKNCFNRYWSKNPHKQGGNGKPRHCTENIYWKSTIDV